MGGIPRLNTFQTFQEDEIQFHLLGKKISAARLADSKYLQAMIQGGKIIIFAYFFLPLFKFRIKYLYDLSAFDAYQMVMMAGLETQFIPDCFVPKVDRVCDTGLFKEFQRSEHSDLADGRFLLLDDQVQLFDAQVCFRPHKLINNKGPLCRIMLILFFKKIEKYLRDVSHTYSLKLKSIFNMYSFMQPVRQYKFCLRFHFFCSHSVICFLFIPL